jgi:hypothetical protein
MSPSFPMDKAQILLHQTGVFVARRITQVALQPYNRQLDPRDPRLPSLQAHPVRCSRMGLYLYTPYVGSEYQDDSYCSGRITQAEIQQGQFSVWHRTRLKLLQSMELHIPATPWIDHAEQCEKRKPVCGYEGFTLKQMI